MILPEHRAGPAITGSGRGLLAETDPPPVRILNPEGRSPFLLTGDHAGSAIPAALGRLGLPMAELRRHIAVDIGIAGLGALLSARLDAPFLHQGYSRLVIDCNRDPASPQAIPEISDGTPVPGNAALGEDDRAERIATIHAPYHDAIARMIGARRAAGRPTIFVALHSFTPAMAGVARPWDIGILHDGGDPAFARSTLAALQAIGGFIVGDNDPYRMDGTDHSVPRHAYPDRSPYVEVEFRQDHIFGETGQALWAGRFAEALEAAAQGLRSVA